jgi:tetratricopeptide (TPR) repeat protein
LSGEAAFYLGQALMRAGRPAEALPHFQRVRSLNPSNKAAPALELSVLASLRRSEEWLSLAANSDPTQTAYDRFRLTGELAPLPADPKAAGADIWLLLHRRFDDLLAFDDRQLARPGLADAERLALLQRRHRTLQALRRDEEAAALGPLMISLGEKLAREPAVDPTTSQRWLARSLVRTERLEEGLALYRRYVDGASPTNQVQERWDREKELAEVYAWLGRPRECVKLLAHLLQVPSGLTVPMLQLSPQWDGVRADPGFQALLVNPRHRAPL